MPSRTFHRRLAAGVVAVAAVSGPAVAGAQAARCAGADAVPRATTLDDAAAATLCLVNRERSRRGLPRLRDHAALGRAGRRYAGLMVRRQFFSHVSPTGSTMADRDRAVGYATDDRAWSIGEALAWGVGERATPAATVDGWLASRPHRRLLLDADFRDLGIGVAVGAPVGRRADGPAATYAAELGLLAARSTSSGVTSPTAGTLTAASASASPAGG
jgi:uncharacterized protein YkwD